MSWLEKNIDHKESENSESGKDLPVGAHRVHIERIITEKNDGSKIQTKKGDPCVLIVYSDDEGREAVEPHTISPRAFWTFRRMLARFGVDAEKLNADGVRPIDWLDQNFCEEQLLGKKGYIRVVESGGRTRAEPIKKEEYEEYAKMKEKARSIGKSVENDDEEEIPF